MSNREKKVITQKSIRDSSLGDRRRTRAQLKTVLSEVATAVYENKQTSDMNGEAQVSEVGPVELRELFLHIRSSQRTAQLRAPAMYYESTKVVARMKELKITRKVVNSSIGVPSVLRYLKNEIPNPDGRRMENIELKIEGRSPIPLNPDSIPVSP